MNKHRNLDESGFEYIQNSVRRHQIQEAKAACKNQCCVFSHCSVSSYSLGKSSSEKFQSQEMGEFSLSFSYLVPLFKNIPSHALNRLEAHTGRPAEKNVDCLLHEEGE